MADSVKSVSPWRKSEEIVVDSKIFKLHYKFTTILLVVFSLLVTCKQYFGDPITCNSSSYISAIYSSAYCWIHGSYVSESNGVKLKVDDEQEAKNADSLRWQKYYHQWIFLFFCFQALLFYIPHYIWESWEEGRIRNLIKDLKLTNWSTQKNELVQYLLKVKCAQNLYAFKYFVCEALNLINVVVQICLMDLFLGDEMSMFDLAKAAFQDTNAMNGIFPKHANCLITLRGASGLPQRHEGLCVMSINVLNEKLFLVLWFWLFALSILTGLSVLYRLLVILCPKLRVYLLLAHQDKFIGTKMARVIVRNISYGEFFVLDHIRNNVNPIVFKDLISEMFSSLNPASDDDDGEVENYWKAHNV